MTTTIWILIVLGLLAGVALFLWIRKRKQAKVLAENLGPAVVPSGGATPDKGGSARDSVNFPKGIIVRSAKAKALVFAGPSAASKVLYKMPAGGTFLGTSTGKEVFDGAYWLLQVTSGKQWQDSGTLPNTVYVGSGSNWKSAGYPTD